MCRQPPWFLQGPARISRDLLCSLPKGGGSRLPRGTARGARALGFSNSSSGKAGLEPERLWNEVRAARVHGFVSKTQAARDLIRAIESVLAGGTFLGIRTCLPLISANQITRWSTRFRRCRSGPRRCGHRQCRPTARPATSGFRLPAPPSSRPYWSWDHWGSA
jgi:hypothetical protein